jgi:hypothetical protein
MRRIIGLAVAGALMLGACGSDDDSEASGDSAVTTVRVEVTTTTTEATTTTTEATTTTTEATTTAPPTTADQLSVEEHAEAYALEKSGGERLGCRSAMPGPDSESDPGCIHSVAFSGCHEGLTGDTLGPLSVEEEFPTEPGLVALYHEAVEDCTSLRSDVPRGRDHRGPRPEARPGDRPPAGDRRGPRGAR